MEKVIYRKDTYGKEKNGRMEMSQDNIDLPPPPPPPTGKRDIKVIALAIICVVLAASLIGVIAVYALNGNNSDLKAQITQKDNTIASLNQNITSLQNQLSQANSQSTSAATYEAQIANLQQELSDANSSITGYQNVLMLNANVTLVSQQEVDQTNNSWTDAFNDVLPYSYAGYIVVHATSTSTTTYVETIYSSFGVNFDSNVTLGASGSAVFPVLPPTVEVRIGNVDQTSSTNASIVTITYYY